MTARRVHELKLDNGFHALLVRRSSLPVVASMIWYSVGSRDERTGETGLSHFLEHMMFKGTERFAKGEIDLLTSKMGGSNNAFTDPDVTAYYFALASDRWERALEIEADRMTGCVFDEQEFTAEKHVVLEELARGEDDPASMMYQCAEGLLFQVHPYHHPVIGWREEVERHEVAAMRDYYRRHYGPNRAFLVAFGDLDVKRTSQRIRELFDSIEPGAEPRGETLLEPPQRGRRRAVLRHPGSITRLVCGARTCSMGERDDFVLDILSCVLSAGRTSRLQRRLVLEEKIAADVSSHNDVRAEPGVFWCTAELHEGVEAEQAERMISEELARLTERQIAASELRRARTRIRSSWLFEEETALGSAMRLGRFEATTSKGHGLIGEALRIFDSVTAKEVKEVARRYFDPERWTTVWSLPEGNGRRGKGRS